MVICNTIQCRCRMHSNTHNKYVYVKYIVNVCNIIMSCAILSVINYDVPMLPWEVYFIDLNVSSTCCVSLPSESMSHGCHVYLWWGVTYNVSFLFNVLSCLYTSNDFLHLFACSPLISNFKSHIIEFSK